MIFSQSNPDAAVLVIIGLFGAIMGSFFNMLIYRVPRGLSILGPSSFCPNCTKSLPLWANVPILSYLLLRGKCAHCKHPIPLRYLLVEVITVVTYVLLYYRNIEYGIIQWFIEAIFVSLLIVVTFTDLETYLIPDIFSIGGLITGLVVSPWNRVVTVMDVFLGVLIGGGVLFLIAYGYQKVRGVEGMGGGDVKLLAMIGAFTGWKGAVMALFISAFTGAIAGLVIIGVKQSKKGAKKITSDNIQGQTALSTMIPYGPFLAFGGLIALIWSSAFWNWYISAF
ncbi:MAG: prepilin peptidase [Thermodesulforhabdaceae bacterium]